MLQHFMQQKYEIPNKEVLMISFRKVLKKKIIPQTLIF